VAASTRNLIAGLSRMTLTGVPRRSRLGVPRGGLVQERVFRLSLASTLCLALELLRESLYGTDTYRFLVWNLVLAWIPLLLGLLIYLRSRHGGSLLELAPIIALWLLFLPNAPYIVTDFIHLDAASGARLWLDGAILVAFAGTGLGIGLVSVYLVHALVHHRRGVLAGWFTVMLVLGSASTGIFLGRFMRWNSWDVIVRPGERLGDLVPRLSDPSAVARAVGITLVLTLLLTSAYVCFYALVCVRSRATSES
jgi:uncharacterized membrane protein